MRKFNSIIIHPDCKETIKGVWFILKLIKGVDILPVIDDKHNHHIDDIRYALYPG